MAAFVSGRGMDFTARTASYQLNPSQSRFLNEELGFAVSQIFPIRQVHGSRILFARKSARQEGQTVPEADGVVTDEYDLPLAVRTADCLPVFFYDAKQDCIGLVHAGWRSSRENISARAVEAMRRQWGSHPRDIKAALGPCIHACCYKVGEEFREYFPKETTQKGESWYLDLPRVNRNQLIEAGVREENIWDHSPCTCCDKNYFSFRREGESAGRMLSLMMLKKGVSPCLSLSS